jgi:Zn-dependent peptidase ImmA (M78 family)
MTDKSGQGMVFFSIDRFLAKTDEQRRWLVAHELLHCSFAVKHRSDGIMTGESLNEIQAKNQEWSEVEALCKM